MTWREKMRPLVAKAIEEGESSGLKGRELRKFVLGKFPYGDQTTFLYATWIDEVRCQLEEPRKLSDYWVKLAAGEYVPIPEDLRTGI